MKAATKTLMGIQILLVVCILWYMRTVKASISLSGGAWLLCIYIGIAVFLLLISGGFGYLFLIKEKSLESIYPFIAFLLGVGFLIILPPMSAPDEIAHYISAYKLSNQMMGKQVVVEDGHVIIRSEDIFLEDYAGAYIYDIALSKEQHVLIKGLDNGVARVIGQTLTKESYIEIVTKGLSHTDISLYTFEDTYYAYAMSSHSHVTTTPLVYIPGAIGITFARLLGVNAIALAFVGRLFNLVVFIFLMWASIRIIPFGKSCVISVGLLPMTLEISASFSYDAMVIGGLVLFFSYCMYLAYQVENVHARDIVLLGCLVLFVMPCKIIYAPLMGLALLIPMRKFGKRKNWFIAFGLVMGCWLFSMKLVNFSIIKTYVEDTGTLLAHAGEESYSMQYMLQNPMRTIQMLYNTILIEFDYYHQSLVGGYLGNMDLGLNTPYFMVVLFYVGLFIMSFKEMSGSHYEKVVVIKGNHRFWCLLLCGIIILGAMISMLIAWTPISSDYIEGVHGRYFLPILPLLLLCIRNDLWAVKSNVKKYIIYFFVAADVYVLLHCFATIVMRF